ncbi:hypothetical protein [Alkalibaculum sporogenes]|nr:hypothetical protein [Alkalibaculum sporogenes]
MIISHGYQHNIGSYIFKLMTGTARFEVVDLLESAFVEKTFMAM